MLLPAVQKVREAAARLKCQNNLKQIGLALHLYHDATLHFPYGSYCPPTPSNTVDASPYNFCRSYNWRLQILPYLEQGALYNQLNFGPNGCFDSNPASTGWTGYQNNTVLEGLVLSVYQCPSSRLSSTNSTPNPHGIGNPSHGQTHCYVGISGGTPDPAGRTTGVVNSSQSFYGAIICGNGILLPNDFVSFASITDGTSNTLMVAEQSGSVGGYDIRAVENGGWLGLRRPGTTQTLTDTDFWGAGITGVRYAINSQNPNLAGADYPGWLNTILNSFHQNGINAVAADGSVHFISDSIDFPTLVRLCVKDDGQTLSSSW
jgi:hypothetical protein